MTPVRTVARGLLSALFVTGGWNSLNNPGRVTGQAKPVADRLAPYLDSIGLPTEPESLVRLNGAVQIVGGLLLATNTASTPAALALAGSLVPTTVAGHPFWTFQDETQRRTQRVQFLKNLGLLGGLLLAAVDRDGRPGLRWQAGHLAGHAQASARRAASTAGRETGRTVRGARRAVRTASRETRLAVRAANLGRRLPG